MSYRPREITSAGTVSGRAALTYGGGGGLSKSIHDGRRYKTFSQGGKEIWLRDHPLFRSGLTTLTNGFRDEREWRSVAADSELLIAQEDLEATAFGPQWTIWTQPERAGYPAAILLRRFVSSWLSAIEGQMLQLLPAIGRGDLLGWSLVEVQRNARHMFDGRPYDCPYGFVEHFTENFAVATDGSLVFQDTDGDQVFGAPDGERFICFVSGPASPYGSKPVAGQAWFTWQLKRTHEQQQARGVRQSITGTPLFDASELTNPGANEGEMAIAEDRLRVNLEHIAELAEEFGILVTLGGLQYKEVVTAGKASDWSDLLDRINSMLRRIRIGETLTAQSEDAGGNRAAGDTAQVSRMARARMYGAQVQAVVNQQLIRHCVLTNFPSAEPEDIPRLRLRALSPVSIEYVQALRGWEGAELDADVLYDAWGLSAPHAGTQRILKASGAQPAAPGADSSATASDPRQLPGTGTAEGPQLSRLPARAALREFDPNQPRGADGRWVEAPYDSSKRREYLLGESYSEYRYDDALRRLEFDDYEAWDGIMGAYAGGNLEPYMNFIAGTDKQPLKWVKGWRYGPPPHAGFSTNFRDQHSEKGVSVMGLGSASDATDGTFALFNDGRPIHEVAGWLTPFKGSDGEPLLVGVKDLGVRKGASRAKGKRARVRSRAEQILQEDAEAIQAGADAIEEEGSPSLEAALSSRMRQLRDAVRATADPETGRPKALAP